MNWPLPPMGCYLVCGATTWVRAIGRRKYLFAGSDTGGERAACLHSLIGTCHFNQIDPHLYLGHVLERIASHPVNRIEELLLPWRVGPFSPLVLSRAA